METDYVDDYTWAPLCSGLTSRCYPTSSIGTLDSPSHSPSNPSLATGYVADYDESFVPVAYCPNCYYPTKTTTGEATYEGTPDFTDHFGVARACYVRAEPRRPAPLDTESPTY